MRSRRWQLAAATPPCCPASCPAPTPAHPATPQGRQSQGERIDKGRTLSRLRAASLHWCITWTAGSQEAARKGCRGIVAVRPCGSQSSCARAAAGHAQYNAVCAPHDASHQSLPTVSRSHERTRNRTRGLEISAMPMLTRLHCPPEMPLSVELQQRADGQAGVACAAQYKVARQLHAAHACLIAALAQGAKRQLRWMQASSRPGKGMCSPYAFAPPARLTCRCARCGRTAGPAP